MSEISQEYEQIFRHLLDKKEIRVSNRKWTHNNPADKIYDAGQLIQQTANRPLQIQNQLSASQLRKKRVAELKKKALKPSKKTSVRTEVDVPVSSAVSTAVWKANDRPKCPTDGPKIPERFPADIFKIERDDFEEKVSEELKKEVELKTKKTRKEAQARIDQNNSELQIAEDKLREEEREKMLRLEKKKVEEDRKKKVEARRLKASELKNRLRREERYEAKLKRLVDEGYSDPEEELKERKRRRSHWRIGTNHKLRKRTNTEISSPSPAKNKLKITDFNHSKTIKKGHIVILHEDSHEGWPPCEHGHLAEITEHDQLSITVILLTDKSSSDNSIQSASVFRTDIEIQICTEDIKSIISGIHVQ